MAYNPEHGPPAPDQWRENLALLVGGEPYWSLGAIPVGTCELPDWYKPRTGSFGPRESISIRSSMDLDDAYEGAVGTHSDAAVWKGNYTFGPLKMAFDAWQHSIPLLSWHHDTQGDGKPMALLLGIVDGPPTLTASGVARRTNENGSVELLDGHTASKLEHGTLYLMSMGSAHRGRARPAWHKTLLRRELHDIRGNAATRTALEAMQQEIAA